MLKTLKFYIHTLKYLKSRECALVELLIYLKIIENAPWKSIFEIRKSIEIITLQNKLLLSFIIQENYSARDHTDSNSYSNLMCLDIHLLYTHEYAYLHFQISTFIYADMYLYQYIYANITFICGAACISICISLCVYIAKYLQK